ncbi:saccharopine dehydrogenase-like oxidoreductase [Styela clava]
MAKEYDFVVFGASGFTGKYVCKRLIKDSEGEEVKIAFAGRSRKKLEDVVNWLSTDSCLSFPLDKIGLIVANVDDQQSLLNMCKQSSLVLDCVGPFKFLGEAVVKACVECGSDYVDVTGEPEFMERMSMKYHEAAKAKGVYIINACGFDCIPSELGMIFAKKNFNGTLSTVENYFSMKFGPKGMTGNYGTYASLVHGISDFNSLKKLRQAVSRKPLPLCGPKLNVKSIHYDKEQKTYALPFFGADVSVVKRSQRYFYEECGEIPAQFAMYFALSFKRIVSILLFAVILKLFTLTSWGKKLLLDNPSFFSAGGFTKEGPTEEQMAESGFEFFMKCKGYKKQLDSGEFTESNGVKKPLDCEMRMKIKGPELGYVLTPIVMVRAAFTVKDERSKLPEGGGVFTPGPAFRSTDIIEKLQKSGVTFQVME